MTENDIARVVVDAAFKIHTKLGPGLLESVYQAVLAYELEKRGLRVRTEVPIPVVYEEVHLEVGFRADLIVEDKVIVELKAIKAIAAVHKKQLLTYLHLHNKRLGLLINFNVVLIKDGITRIVNRLEEPGTSRKGAKSAKKSRWVFFFFALFAPLREVPAAHCCGGPASRITAPRSSASTSTANRPTGVRSGVLTDA
jgi:GxxExxY protein